MSFDRKMLAPCMSQENRSLILSHTVFLVAPIALVCFISCASSSHSEPTLLIYQLAHNTERVRIINETSLVLQLHNFTIEHVDAGRNQSALRTHWRPVLSTPSDTLDRAIWIRDRALLHISPRGKSTIMKDVYQMVIAKLQFEVEMKTGERGDWIVIFPVESFRDHYASIVKDIRNRMLKYRYEL